MATVFSNHRLAVALYDSAGIHVTLQLSNAAETAPAAILEAAFHLHESRLKRMLSSQADSENALRVCPLSISYAQDGAFELIGNPRQLSHALAVQEAYSDVLSEAHALPGLYDTPHAGFASSVSLHAAVISSEGLLLVPRRSEYWAKDAGLWGVSFSTDLLPDDFKSGTLDDATLRLFDQVLSVDDMSAVLGSVRTLGLLVDMQTYKWYFLTVADFRGLGTEFSAATLLAQREYSLGSYEFDDCAAINLSAYEFQHLVARKGDLHDIRALAEMQLVSNAIIY